MGVKMGGMNVKRASRRGDVTVVICCLSLPMKLVHSLDQNMTNGGYWMSETNGDTKVVEDAHVGAPSSKICQMDGGKEARLAGVEPMICRYFKVAHRDMVFLKFILEAYEGMNVMSTVDNKAGIIRIAIMPGFVADMDGLLTELGKQVTMEPVEWRDESCSY